VLTSLPTEYVTSPKIARKPLVVCGKVIHMVPKPPNLGSETPKPRFRNPQTSVPDSATHPRFLNPQTFGS
jgi:hypothetical protein